MENNIKLANDACSILMCAISDYNKLGKVPEAFPKALYQNFPKEVGDHIIHLVSDYIDEKTK